MSPLYSFIHEQIQAGTRSLYPDTVAYLERILLNHVLRHTCGNQLRAAEILGMTRGFLRNKIREHGIRITQAVSLDNEQEEAEGHLTVSEPLEKTGS